MKRIAFSLLSVVVLIAMALPVGSGAVLAQPSNWPGDAEWIYPANCYSDPQEDEHPAQLDLIGNATMPAAYYYFDTVNGSAFFRERVLGDPSGPGKFASNTWVVLFDLPERGNYEYLVSIDGNNETVDLWNNTVRENLTWNPLLRDEAEIKIKGYPTENYTRIVPDGTGHYFVDWAIPLTDLTNLGIDANTTMYFATSGNANNYNKDHLVCYDFPDLVITEKSEAWVSLANKTYNVSYTVCNEAAAEPAEASNTTITIDGVDVLEDPVPGLAAGTCYNSTVGPFTMSGTNDTIMVCADNGDVVDESNEYNNCMENIFVCELPVANFTANNTDPCVNTSVQFTDLSTGTIDSWSWDFPGGSPSSASTQGPHTVTYSSAGNYTVNLTVSNACGSDDEVKAGYITVGTAPTAAFSGAPTSGCAPLTVNFTDLSMGSPTGWIWDFPGGSPSSASTQGPHTVTYSSTGSYNVSLTVENECGNDTETKTGYITVSAVTYNLTVTSDGCCPINVSGAASGTVSAGENQTFPGIGEGGNVTVSADDSAVCCEFDSWSDAGAQTHNITMDSDKSVTAYCSVPGPFTITATAGANGNIAPSGAVVVNCGADRTFNITADACYEIEDVVVDGSPVGAVASYTFTNVTANHTISATFSVITYTLTVNVTPSGGGNVTVNGTTPSSYPNSTTWVCGDNVTLNAVVASGYSFDHWGGALSGNATPTNITMDSNKDVTAYFTHVGIHYNLTVNVTPGGSGDIEVNGAAPGSYPHSYTFNESELVDLTAVPAGGYCFVSWSKDLSGSVNPTDITMTSDKNVTAHFTPIYNLTVTSGGCCPIDVSGAVNGTIAAGENQTFTGIVEGGNVTVSADDSAVCCEFDSWSDAGAQTHTITMDSDKSVTAYCSVPSYNLTVNVTPGGGGNVTVNGTTPSGYPNVTTWVCGEEVTVNAVAAGGYEFVSWSGDLSGNTTPVNITMNGDKSVTAHFSAITYNLTVTSNGCCPIDVSGAASGTVSAGGSETFTGIGEGGNVTVSADDSAVCCEFDSWSDTGAQTHAITMDSDKSVTAYCSVPSYDLTIDVTPGGGGNVTVNGTTPSGYPNTTTWTCGDEVTVNAVAAGGYEFDHWSGDLSGNTTPTNITMNGDKDVTANFEEHLPKICVEPSSLPFTLPPNTTDSKIYTITNCGGGTLNWDSSSVTYDPNGNMSWLSQNITSGSLTANASDTVLVTVNTTGLEKGTYNATITITGSTFNLSVILIVTPTGTHIDVCRELPADAMDYDAEYPGDWFWVNITFQAPVDDFNSIGLTDYAPAGWEVDTDVSWCIPVADYTKSPYNKAEYSWEGPYNATQNFSARYKVTIPATASPGSSYWPNCTPYSCPPCEGSPINSYPVWVEYWFGAEGPYESCITCDREKIVTVPGCVVGETRDVNGDLLDTVLVTLHEDPPGTTPPDSEPEDTDSSSIVINVTAYENCADDTGYYYQIATKYCYKTVNSRPQGDGGTMPGVRNPNHPDYINWTTPELLAAGFGMDFVGDYGLVCKAASMSYAMESINHHLFTPLGDDDVTPEPDWKLSNWKAMESVASWQFPCGCCCG